MPDFILEIVNGQAVVRVDGSDLLARLVAQAQAARDAVRPLYGNGPPAAALGVDGSFYRDMTNPLLPLEWFKVGATWQGPQSLKGTPGGNVSDVGNYAAAKAANLANTQPGTTTIRLSDRGKAVFERDTGAYGDLLALYPTGEDYWWFRDAGATRWILAGEQPSIQHVGAVQGKAVNNTTAIQRALDFGTLTKRSIHVPAGTWGHSDVITIGSNTGLYGIPGMSILWCPIRANAAQYAGVGAIVMRGDRCSLYGITRVHYLPRPVSLADRTPNDNGNGITVAGATNFLISHCRTEGPQGAALMLRGCQNGRITNNVFDSSLADAIHVTAAAKNDIPLLKADGSYDKQNPIPIPARWLHIADNIVTNAGDDNIAVVSYQNDHEYSENSSIPVTTIPGYWTDPVVNGGTRTYRANCQSIEIVGNSTYGGDARGITVVGGKNVNIVGNYIEDPVVAGILAYGEESYKTYGCENVNIVGNTLISTGNDSSYKPLRYDAYGAGMTDRNGNAGLTRNPDGRANASVIIGGRSATYPGNVIAFRDNLLVGMRQRGVTVGANANNVDVTGNTFRDASGVPVFADAGFNVKFDNNRVVNCVDAAIGVNIYNMSGAISVCGNALDIVATGKAGGVDAIHFEGAPPAGVTSVHVCNNTITGPLNYERFVEAFFNNIICENNVGAGDVAIGNPPYSIKQRLRAASLANTASASDIVTALKNAGLMSP